MTKEGLQSREYNLPAHQLYGWWKCNSVELDAEQIQHIWKMEWNKETICSLDDDSKLEMFIVSSKIGFSRIMKIDSYKLV